MSDLETPIEALAEELARDYLVDQGLLKPGGRRELLGEMARLRDRGRIAHVLLIPRGEPLEPRRELWDLMRPAPGSDLLLIFNGQRWEARGWALEPDAIARILDQAEPELRVYYARGLVAALRMLATASDPRLADDEDLPLWLPASAGVLALAGAVAWVVRRRAERERQGRAAFNEALSAARGTFTEVVFGGEDVALDHAEEADRIQLRAAELHQELDDLERTVAEDPKRCRQAVTLGRVQHVHDELRVLASTVLQRRS